MRDDTLFNPTLPLPQHPDYEYQGSQRYCDNGKIPEEGRYGEPGIVSIFGFQGEEDRVENGLSIAQVSA